MTSGDYTWNSIENSVTVEACKTTSELRSPRPFGTISFGYIELPDYVVETEPFKIYGWSDAAQRMDIFAQEEGTGVRLTTNNMKSGPIELIDFTPSDYYAFKENVSFTLVIKTSSLSYPSVRIIIAMPPTI